MSPINDARLLELLHQGDPQAIDQLFDRYYDTLHRIAYRILSDREAAKDIVQEVFIVYLLPLNGQ